MPLPGNHIGKVAFITGAGTGIGRATALAFAREGASVVVTGIADADTQETARLFEQEGGRVLAIKCDVLKEHEIKAALDKTIEVFGRLDFAFNNAGIEQPVVAAADVSVEAFDRMRSGSA